MSTERVSIVKVKEQRLDEALARLIVLLGDLNGIVPPNSRVLVKPNFVFPPTHAGITHPELVESVVRLIAETAPAEILIGEGSADVYTGQGFRFQQMDRVAARYGAKLVDLNLEEGIKTPVPQGLGRDYIMVPRSVVDSDILISLPVFKLWGGSPLSLALKNLIGLYGANHYGHNKDSQQKADDPRYAIPGDVGTELGAHQPDVATSICAMNAVVPIHLSIIDALEGGDGKGNWIRLDTLIAGTNPVATDTVACHLTGITAADHRTFSLCHEYDLGPTDMSQIEVVGEKIRNVTFDLERLRTNVLEMPLAFCLELLNTQELLQIQRALHVYELVPEDTPILEQREALLTFLTEIISEPNYFTRALEKCTDCALDLLKIITEKGGTSGSPTEISATFKQTHNGLYYHPSHRILTRLGLAYLVDGANRPYYLLAEGVSESCKHLSSQ